MLHPQLAQILKNTQRHLLNEGKLLPENKLQVAYAIFRDRFNIDRLQSMDGEALLKYMHELNRTNRDALVYWLEFKNDEEFSTRVFGSISGGSALKFGVYPDAKTGAWMAAEGNRPVEITLEQAIEIARRHRDQLKQGLDLLAQLPSDAPDNLYRELQHELNLLAPDVSETMWGHKYFHFFYPDKLDDFHITAYQRFNLVKLLQSNIPDEREGRYITAGKFVAVANELNMPMNHLTAVLNHCNGKPHRYWSVLASDQRNPIALNWRMQYEGGFAAITWEELGDLSDLTHNRESKAKLRQMMERVYRRAITIERQGIFDFATDIATNDFIVAFEPRLRTVVGIGRVTGSYYFEPSTAPHRLPVEWLSSDEWQLPNAEGLHTVPKEIRHYTNQVEIERHVLEAELLDEIPLIIPAIIHGSQTPPLRLKGLPGRVQSILERKGQVILYGPPGTGKTFWAEFTACELSARQIYGKSFSELPPEQRQRIFGNSDSYVQLCSFHPAYGYEDFLEGYRPHPEMSQMTLVRQNGIFKRLCELANKNSGNSYYLIIDEINRGDIPRIFGELLTVMEKDKRGKSVLLPLSGESFSVPSNVFVIGTMNTADRSIALLDTALRRRFGFIELLPDPSQLDTVIEGIPLGAWLSELNNRVLQYIGRDARNLQVGHAFFLEGGRPIASFEKFARVIREDIIPLLEEYCYEDYTALRQILGTTLVDEQNQRIRQELFESGREHELVQALLEPTPELTTLASVTEANEDSADIEEEI